MLIALVIDVGMISIGMAASFVFSHIHYPLLQFTGVKTTEESEPKAVVSPGERRIRRRALVRKALQQIALWVHCAHYVRGASTVMAKVAPEKVVEVVDAADLPFEVDAAEIGAIVDGGLELKAAAETSTVIAATGEEAPAEIPVFGDESPCAKQIRQFTMSAAKASGQIDEESLAELELVLALPRRKAPARAGESKEEGDAKDEKDEKEGTDEKDEKDTKNEKNEKNGEESGDEYNEEESGGEDEDDELDSDEEQELMLEAEQKKWALWKIEQKWKLDSVEREARRRGELEALEAQIMAWQCPISVLEAVPSTHSGCGLLGEAVLAFTHSSILELLAAEAMVELMNAPQANGKLRPVHEVMSELALPLTPAMKAAVAPKQAADEHEDGEEDIFVSAFSCISRSSILSKVMYRLRQNIYTLSQKRGALEVAYERGVDVREKESTDGGWIEGEEQGVAVHTPKKGGGGGWMGGEEQGVSVRTPKKGQTFASFDAQGQSGAPKRVDADTLAMTPKKRGVAQRAEIRKARAAENRAILLAQKVATCALRAEGGCVKYMTATAVSIGPSVATGEPDQDSNTTKDGVRFQTLPQSLTLNDREICGTLASLLAGCCSGGEASETDFAVHTLDATGARMLARSVLPLFEQFGTGNLAGITSLDLSDNPGLGKRQLPAGWMASKRSGVPHFLQVNDGHWHRRHPGGKQVALQTLADALVQDGAPRLKVLRMRNTTLTGFAHADVCESEEECAAKGESKVGILIDLMRALGPQLDTLDVSGNHIGAEGLDAIVNASGGVLSELPKLQTLVLANCALTNYGTVSSAIKELGELMETDANVLPSLSDVDVSGNMLCGAPADVVSDTQAVRAFGRDDTFALEGLQHLVAGLCGPPTGSSASPRPSVLAPRPLVALHIQDVTPSRKNVQKGQKLPKKSGSKVGAKSPKKPKKKPARAPPNRRPCEASGASNQIIAAGVRQCGHLASFTCDTFALRPGVQELVLSGLGLESSDCELLAAALGGSPHWQSLHTLDLSKNMIGVQSNGLTTRVEPQGLQNLCQALHKGVAHSLRVIDLHGNMLAGEPAGCSIAMAFRGLDQLHTLLLGNNRLYHSGIQKFSREIANSFSLRVLDLSHNGIVGRFDPRHNPELEGITVLFRELSAGKGSLDMLDLSGNCLGSDGCAEIAKLLKKDNQGFKRGGISKGWQLRLSDDLLLSAVLPEKKIRAMELRGLNQRLAMDQVAMAKAFTGNEAGLIAALGALPVGGINRLDLSNNYLSGEGIDVLAVQLTQRRCETLESLDLRGNGLTREDKLTLGKTLMSVHVAASNGKLGSRTDPHTIRNGRIMSSKPADKTIIKDGKFCLRSFETDAWSLVDFYERPFSASTAELEPMVPMTELLLSHAKLTGADMQLLCGVMASGAFGSTLRTLDLSHNDICDSDPREYYHHNLQQDQLRVAIERTKIPGKTKLQQDAAEAAATAAAAAMASSNEVTELVEASSKPTAVYNKWIERMKEAQQKLQWKDSFAKGARVEVQLRTNEGVYKWYSATVRFCRIEYNRDGPTYKYNVDYDYGDLGVRLLCKVMPALHSIRTVNLQANGIHAKGTECLMVLLKDEPKQCPALTVIDVSGPKGIPLKVDLKLCDALRTACQDRGVMVKGADVAVAAS
jgi:Ran GTPase-activating protein (RanGAP) involved in mRNA processing and transport